tara:strand:- start:3913 stop:4518 length:606 start_codon:yes stop_codon:yes gene_type:complete
MNNKIKKLKRTRKVKKNVQSGGYIVSPTNPYFMAVAAVIGGLYAYGKTQSSDTPVEEKQQSGGRKFRRTRRRNKCKKGTRRRKQKGGDRSIWDMVVDLTTMFWIRRPTSVAPKYNDIHDLKMTIIKKVDTTDDMVDLEGGLKAIRALLLDVDENGNNEIDNQRIFEPGLREHLIDILKKMCERPEADCSNQLIQDILHPTQ